MRAVPDAVFVNGAGFASNNSRPVAWPSTTCGPFDVIGRLKARLLTNGGDAEAVNYIN